MRSHMEAQWFLTADALPHRAEVARCQRTRQSRTLASRLRRPPAGMRVGPESSRQDPARPQLREREAIRVMVRYMTEPRCEAPTCRADCIEQASLTSEGRSQVHPGRASTLKTRRRLRLRREREQGRLSSPRARDPSTRRIRESLRAARARSAPREPPGAGPAGRDARPPSLAAHSQSAWRRRPCSHPRARLSPRCAPPCPATWDPRRRQHEHHAAAPSASRSCLQLVARRPEPRGVPQQTRASTDSGQAQRPTHEHPRATWRACPSPRGRRASRQLPAGWGSRSCRRERGWRDRPERS